MPGPPALRFLDSAGVDLAIQYGQNFACSSTVVRNCVLSGSAALQATDLTPAQHGPPPSAAVTIMSSSAQLILPCESPNVFANTLGFVFPDVGELQVPLDRLEIRVCDPRVSLFSFE